MRRVLGELAPSFVFASFLVAGTAAATPGPDSVVVIANANVPESVALAERYAEARDVPRGQVCPLDLPDTEDVTLEEYETRLLAPLRACLDASGARGRVEAALLIRGVPLRVDVPVPDSDGTEIVSVAAALGLWESELTDGTPILGQPPGQVASCGGPCYAARWPNPYHGLAFDPGWTSELGGVTWRPLLVTMLHGRSYEDAARLLESALLAEEGEPSGEILFMDGADPARGALDGQYDAVIAALAASGADATRTPFDANLTGHTFAGFFTGTASLGETIEGNTFSPGSIVDNLTSYGALPVNFRESGESQVSIARWVARGVAGVHGTVEEPLNNCFPSRFAMVAYVDGATLAEAFHMSMPFVYWRNLVLGDPMAAPYARRPAVTVRGAADDERTRGAISLEVEATDPNGLGVESVVVYLDGIEVARSASGALSACLVVPAGEDQQLLVVARGADDPSDVRPYRSKGWRSLSIDSEGLATDCTAPSADAGLPDAGIAADAGTIGEDAGCGCRAGGTSPAPGALVFAGLGLLVARRRRSRVTPGELFATTRLAGYASTLSRSFCQTSRYFVSSCFDCSSVIARLAFGKIFCSSSMTCFSTSSENACHFVKNESSSMPTARHSSSLSSISSCSSFACAISSAIPGISMNAG